MEKLEQYLREKIDYKNRMHDFKLSTETLKIWLDDYKELSSGCVCNEEDKHGWTTVKCCNRCGLSIEDFWNK